MALALDIEWISICLDELQGLGWNEFSENRHCHNLWVSGELVLWGRSPSKCVCFARGLTQKYGLCVITMTAKKSPFARNQSGRYKPHW